MGTTVEKQIEGAVRLLREFFPEQGQLYFPLVYAFLAWAADRHRQWKKRIFGWQVWPDPTYIRVKPDAFVLDFFRRHPGLRRAFHREIEQGDLSALRFAFLRLYPLLGLEDPFLTALFHQELENGEYAAVLRDFDSRLDAARRAVQAARGEPRLLRGLKTLAEESVSLGAAALTRSDVRGMISDILEQRKEGTDG